MKSLSVRILKRVIVTCAILRRIMSFQVVVVTGAASGIGAAIALAFAQDNAGLCITDINEHGLREIGIKCEELTKNKVLEIAADVTKAEDPDHIVTYALKEFGKIDVLVNCAGIYGGTNLQDSDVIEKFDKIFAINLRSVIVMTKKALPALIKSKGCIINLSSVGSNLMLYNNLAYTVTKAGVTTFTKCAAFELANLGVRVNSISPGSVKTNLLKNAGLGENEEKEMWKSLIDKTPLKRLVKAEEVAELAVYLASNKAASITGSDFLIDSGLILGSVETPCNETSE